MQVILEDEDEWSSSRGANSVGIIICTERISRYIEEEYIRRPGIRRSRI